MAEKNTIPTRSDWVFGSVDNILNDKNRMVKSAVLQMLNKTLKIFKYNNLPKTIKKKDLEIQLQVGGFNIWKEVKGELYTFTGGLGGKPNPYYLPTIATVANPALNYSKNLDIDENCVVMLNDDFYEGLMPLFSKYGNLLVEAELSLKYAIWNARIPALIEADNDNAYHSALAFIDKIVQGEDYGVISSSSDGFFEGVKTHEFYKMPYIKEIIEAIQYIKGSWYNEIGLNAAFNMKREAINEAEATLNEDILYPTIDTMLECRQDGLELINKMYGTNITVELDSVWAKTRKQDSLIIEKEEAEIDSIENQTEEGEENDEDEGNTNETAED